MINDLINMLKLKRPAYDSFDALFVATYLAPLGVVQDKKGNCIKVIPNADGTEPEVCWSSHTDTVHRKGGYQSLRMNGQFISLSHKSNSNCLGADDTAGVWIMVEMIKSKKPGLYIFHRGEECGGIGSGFIATDVHSSELFKHIKYAIALDRKSTRSVITKQRGQRCCSDKFGLSLAKALDMKFELDTGGTFTDTANYTDLIGECTNISVGYYDQHSSRERLDLAFCNHLRKNIIEMDYSLLESERKPGEKEVVEYAPRHSRWYSNTYQRKEKRKAEVEKLRKDVSDGCKIYKYDPIEEDYVEESIFVMRNFKRKRLLDEVTGKEEQLELVMDDGMGDTTPVGALDDFSEQDMEDYMNMLHDEDSDLSTSTNDIVLTDEEIVESFKETAEYKEEVFRKQLLAMIDLCKDYPVSAVTLMEDMGITYDALCEQIHTDTGVMVYEEQGVITL